MSEVCCLQDLPLLASSVDGAAESLFLMAVRRRGLGSGFCSGSSVRKEC